MANPPHPPLPLGSADAAADTTARLLLVSALALTTAGMAAVLRANVACDLQRVFLNPIDKARTPPR